MCSRSYARAVRKSAWLLSPRQTTEHYTPLRHVTHDRLDLENQNTYVLHPRRPHKLKTQLGTASLGLHGTWLYGISSQTLVLLPTKSTSLRVRESPDAGSHPTL
ncbi:hypothetical protein BaRGS_00022482 [Batillaria attramentaria]|uniref:Uncharacterized protein n=1 Tax=Batillaria attramentaria TaxID=370345 RepID=A0ABD0KGT9_9CAEN